MTSALRTGHILKDRTYHLNGDMQNSFEVEFATALLEQVLKTLSEQVHYHDMVHFSVLSLLVADEMQERHEGLASQLVDQLTFPEEHDMTLHLYGFFLY